MLVALVLALMLGQETAASSRVFGCGGPFTADLTEQRLIEIYGAANVRAGDVYVGEGNYESGTIVFPDSPKGRIEVLWQDSAKRMLPAAIGVRRDATDWRTVTGITIGTDLKTIERANGRPFRLLGFDWDYQGTVMSWSAGRLSKQDGGACRVRMRLRPTGDEWSAISRAIARQVSGMAEFSSGHPAMQQINPRVYELWLAFAEPRRHKAPQTTWMPISSNGRGRSRAAPTPGSNQLVADSWQW